jgi:LacI family transcriptional regulator
VGAVQKSSTLKDVAARAAVSTATVRRVLHNHGPVADETRQAVLAALEETGYRLNSVAQGLRRGRTYTIGHLVRALVPNPFPAHIATGVARAALAHGYSMLLYNVQRDAQLERLGVETLLQRRVDALIFTTPVEARNVEIARQSGIPVVQVERVAPVATHTVTADNYRGALSATEHLIGLGHRRIAFIGVSPSSGGSTAPAWLRALEEERLDGYRDGLGRHGIPIDAELIALGRYFQNEESSDGDSSDANDGYISTRRLLQASSHPTAIFAASDLLAAGALQAIRDGRLRVPEDISVIGMDNTLAPFLSPPLTTVEQPMLALGELAVKLVMDDLAARVGGAPVPRQERLPMRLIVRASTGPPR